MRVNFTRNKNRDNNSSLFLFIIYTHNEIYFQWGSVSNNGYIAIKSITFPMIFKNTVLNALCSSAGATTENTINSGMVANLTLNGMKVTVDSEGGYWNSIGK